MTTRSLNEIWVELAKQGHETDKNSVHSYIPVYEEILEPYRFTALNVLEVGLFNGSSMRMWEYYFQNAEVFGIDCDEQPHGGMADLRPMIAEGTHNIAIGDATDQYFIRKQLGRLKLDVVIEDAGHDLMQQLQIYYNLKPYLNKHSIYIIEDIQNIDANRSFFESIDPDKSIGILDRRHIKGRYDDVLVIIRDK